VNESRKRSSHCSSKDRGSLESTGPNRSVRMQRLRRTRLMRHAEKNEINLKIKKSANMVTLDRSTVTKCSSWGRLAIQIARDPFACRGIGSFKNVMFSVSLLFIFLKGLYMQKLDNEEVQHIEIERHKLILKHMTSSFEMN
jgi:hypothetical protein